MFQRVLAVIRDRPQPVNIARNEPIHARAAYPQPEITQALRRVEEAPRPPMDTQFAGVGRDAAHAPTPIIRYGGGLAIADWLSVAGWPFAIAKVPSALVVNRDRPNRGRQLPFRERPNIVAPQATTLGDLYSLSSTGGSDPSLLKITF